MSPKKLELSSYGIQKFLIDFRSTVHDRRWPVRSVSICGDERLFNDMLHWMLQLLKPQQRTEIVN